MLENQMYQGKEKVKEEIEWIRTENVPKRRRPTGRWTKLVKQLIERKGEAVKITGVKPSTACGGIRAAARRLGVPVKASTRKGVVYAYVEEEKQQT